MRKTFLTNVVDSGGHAAVFYNQPKELWQLLAEYFKVGFDESEMGVFVTQFTPEQVVDNLRKAGQDFSQQVMKGDFRIFNMQETYLPEGRFVADFMMNNVIAFIEDAKQLGYSGLRTAGEMGWLEQHAHFHDEAMIYEKSVNTLIEENPTFTGICIYSLKNGSVPSKDFNPILNTHPSYFYNGELLRSNNFPA